ncbi:MAG: MotA/TolQ/ExbB proton channel family protein [Thermoanaerobaculia bacterium]|nr:MotA/TolQ/ExbB proton channel family protein [Thermoanaerobaculia bacterium]
MITRWFRSRGSGEESGFRGADVIRGPIFEVGRLMAAVFLGAAIVLACAFYSLLNRVSEGRIESELAMGSDVKTCGPATGVEAFDISGLEGEMIPEHLRKYLREGKDEMGEREFSRKLWGRLCTSLEVLKAHNDGNPLHVGVEEFEEKTDEAGLNLLGSGVLGSAGEGDVCTEKPQNGKRFGWLQLVCLRQRILGVGFADNLMGLREVVPQAAVDGTVYRYHGSRSPARAKGPREKRQLETLQAFDRTVQEAITHLQESTQGPRWWMRNLNGAFQWGILTCGLWAILLLGYLWLQARWQLLAVANGKGLYRQFLEDCEDRDPDDVVDQYFRWLSRSSSVLVDWIIEIVPLLGFIGTVVGMIAAMAGVAGVVASEPGPELVNAMGRVSDSLSLAFSTTFVALALSIVLYLMRPSVYRAQELVIDTVQRVAARNQVGREGSAP